jgi:hypothetical protein
MSVVFSAVTDRRYIFSKHPAEHGIGFNVIVAASHSHEREIFKAVFPLPVWRKGR